MQRRQPAASSLFGSAQQLLSGSLPALLQRLRRSSTAMKQLQIRPQSRMSFHGRQPLVSRCLPFALASLQYAIFSGLRALQQQHRDHERPLYGAIWHAVNL